MPNLTDEEKKNREAWVKMQREVLRKKVQEELKRRWGKEWPGIEEGAGGGREEGKKKRADEKEKSEETGEEGTEEEKGSVQSRPLPFRGRDLKPGKETLAEKAGEQRELAGKGRGQTPYQGATAKGPILGGGEIGNKLTATEKASSSLLQDILAIFVNPVRPPLINLPAAAEEERRKTNNLLVWLWKVFILFFRQPYFKITITVLGWILFWAGVILIIIICLALIDHCVAKGNVLECLKTFGAEGLENLWRAIRLIWTSGK